MRQFLCHVVVSSALAASTLGAACDNPNADVANNHVTCEFERETDLIVDCRCDDKKRTILECNNPESPSVPTSARVGKGPSLFPLMFTATIRIGPGYLDPVKREIYPAISFDDPSGAYQGFVLAVNIDTGDRRLVTGSIPGQESRGAGPAMDGARVTDLGPDGKLYVWAESAVHMKIFRVDLDTGDRELVWTDYDYTQTATNIPEHAQCVLRDGNGDELLIQTNENGFAVGPDGSFYLNVFAIEGAGGVQKIAPDGRACGWLTLWGADSLGDPARKDVGSGPEGDARNFTALKYNKSSNTVWGIGFFGQLTQIDVATGDRTALLDTGRQGTYSISTAPELQMAVLGGTDAPSTSITVIDLPKDRVFEAACTATPPYSDLGCIVDGGNGPFPRTFQHLQPTWIDPKNGNLILANGNVAFFRGELSTGNTVLISL